MSRNDKIYAMNFSTLYDLYVKKVERKERSKEEVDVIITWLTGYSQDELYTILETETTIEQFFNQAPLLNPCRNLIKGVICGIRVENMEESMMKEIRYMDKLIDELAKGKSMEKILRK